jgi:diacylglycerol kinase (ATP)
VSGDPEHTDSGVTGPADPTADRSAVPVILNPTARRGAVLKRIDPLVEAFAAHGLEARLVRSASEELTQSELAAELRGTGGARVVVALGGDGMARSVAAGLLGTTDTALGIIAGGRGNDLIGKLGIPKGIEASVSEHRRGSRPRSSTSSTSTGRSASATSASAWIRPCSGMRTQRSASRAVGSTCTGSCARSCRPKSIDLQLTVDGRAHRLPRPDTAGFANSGRYGGGLRLSPTAEARRRAHRHRPPQGRRSCRRLAAELVAFMLR